MAKGPKYPDVTVPLTQLEHVTADVLIGNTYRCIERTFNDDRAKMGEVKQEFQSRTIALNDAELRNLVKELFTTV